MPRRNVRAKPRDYVVAGEWPYAELEHSDAAELTQSFAASLQSALVHESVRQVAERADLANRTIYGLLTGDAWPNVSSVTKLEMTLGRLLWPRDTARRLKIVASNSAELLPNQLAEITRLVDAGRELDDRWDKVMQGIQAPAEPLARDALPQPEA